MYDKTNTHQKNQNHHQQYATNWDWSLKLAWLFEQIQVTNQLQYKLAENNSVIKQYVEAAKSSMDYKFIELKRSKTVQKIEVWNLLVGEKFFTCKTVFEHSLVRYHWL